MWSSGLPVSWRRCEIRLASTSRRGERFQHLSRSLIFSLALALARRLPPPPRRPPGPSRLPAATPDPPAHPQPRRPCPAPPFLCVSCPPFAVPSTNGAPSRDRVPLSLRLHLSPGESFRLHQPLLRTLCMRYADPDPRRRHGGPRSLHGTKRRFLCADTDMDIHRAELARVVRFMHDVKSMTHFHPRQPTHPSRRAHSANRKQYLCRPACVGTH